MVAIAYALHILVKHKEVSEDIIEQLGKGDKEHVAITGELKHGDKVATRGAERLTDGDKVIVQ
jgi:hypothetical protein